MKYLGIDYGLSMIGLAVSEGALAEPLIQIQNTTEEEVISKIKHICSKERIKKIVIGLSEGVMANRTKEFAALLTVHLKKPVFLFDETLSSHTARQYLLLSGAKKKKRQTKEHQVAAAVILQAYLDDVANNLL